ncbi:hypothetical protein NPIL_158771, partial [Nephila pilipes]
IPPDNNGFFRTRTHGSSERHQPQACDQDNSATITTCDHGHEIKDAISDIYSVILTLTPHKQGADHTAKSIEICQTTYIVTKWPIILEITSEIDTMEVITPENVKRPCDISVIKGIVTPVKVVVTRDQ